MCTTKGRMEWEMKLKYELKIQHLLCVPVRFLQGTTDNRRVVV